MWDCYGNFYPSSLRRPCLDVTERRSFRRKINWDLCIQKCPSCVDRECKTGIKVRKEM
jgi:hypothetical protein